MRKTGMLLIIVGTVIIVVYAFVIFYTHERYCTGCTVNGAGVRFFQDNYDRTAYYLRGSWVSLGFKAAHKAWGSEYPPLAEYIFAAPFAIGKMASPGKPFPKPSLVLNLLSALMVPFYLGLMIVTRWLLRERDLDERRLFVLLLPGFLYFSLNRYDVIPALIVSAGLLMVWRDRPDWAGVFLGLGAMVKWYPALLAPIWFIYFWRRRPLDALRLAGAFAVTAIALSLPLLIGGGLDAYLDAYRFQLGRHSDALSIFGLLASFSGRELPRWVGASMLVLQLIVPLIAFFVGVKDREALLDWSLVAILAFVFFNKIYSPQWIIWLVPLLILRLKGRTWFVILITWDIVSYLLFPALYDVYNIRENPPGVVYSAAVIVKTALFIALASVPAAGAWRSLREGRSPALA